MLEFRVRNTGEIKYEAEIRRGFNGFLPDVLDAASCNLLGVDPILASPKPDCYNNQYVQRDGVVRDGLGNWVQKWIVCNFTQEQMDQKLRAEKERCLIQIDSDRDRIVSEVIGARLSEYTRAEKAARDFKASGYAMSPVPRSVQSWAAIKGWSAEQAANDIILQADSWIDAEETLREHRLEAKEKTRTAPDSVTTQNVMGEWNAFIQYIRGRLGVK